ncbi:MAG: PhnD/SsuA/transferrin family substrate-binding protein [Proteobacteria bacterium]|nr:PhnD/SsuA/transferrin family substrate-binding protein [Pseudomonadota bacterium]
MKWIANARMYAVTPGVEAAWRTLLAHVADDAGVELEYFSYPAPAPLENLWDRPDLGAVFMCGYPVARGMAPVVPLAAPIPAAEWARGEALYRTDLIVRVDSPYRTLEDTFGGRAGWTVAHSQSGFNAFRHELLRHRRPDRQRLYAHVEENLVTARAVLDSVREGRIDVGPLDAYWHLLIRRHAPELVAGIRVLCSTPATPIPGFIAARGAPRSQVDALQRAFAAASARPWFEPLAGTLLVTGFAPVDASRYQLYLDWDREARAAGYATPG